MKQVTLILPVFNNSSELEKTLYQFSQSKDFSSVCSNLLIIDDGSDEDISLVVKKFELKAQIKLVRFKHNLGKGKAIEKGISFSDTKFIVFCDSDQPFFFEDLLNFMKKLRNQNIDLLIGNRKQFYNYNKKKIGLFRISLSYAFNKLSHLILGIGEYDNQCGLKGFKKKVADDLFKNMVTTRYAFDAEVIFRAINRNYQIQSYPVRLEKNGETSIKFIKDGLTMAIDLMRIRLFSLKNLNK